MAKRIGIGFIVLGFILIAASAFFLVYNREEDKNAGEFSNSLLYDMRKEMGIIVENSDSEHKNNSSDINNLPQQPNSQPEFEIGETEKPEADATDTPPIEGVKEMPTLEVNGYDCLGILSIPALELELPVLADWSYSKLKKAPCHYFGSYYENNFVIAAHNYDSHFGRLSTLKEGDYVLFTNVSGERFFYEVSFTETLEEESTKEMISSGFDLSLYTCTTGGGKRVTVRCKLMG